MVKKEVSDDKCKIDVALSDPPQTCHLSDSAGEVQQSNAVLPETNTSMKSCPLLNSQSGEFVEFFQDSTSEGILRMRVLDIETFVLLKKQCLYVNGALCQGKHLSSFISIGTVVNFDAKELSTPHASGAVYETLRAWIGQKPPKFELCGECNSSDDSEECDSERFRNRIFKNYGLTSRTKVPQSARKKYSVFHVNGIVKSLTRSFGIASFQCKGNKERAKFFKENIYIKGKKVKCNAPLFEVLSVEEEVKMDVVYSHGGSADVFYTAQRVYVQKIPSSSTSTSSGSGAHSLIANDIYSSADSGKRTPERGSREKPTLQHSDLDISAINTNDLSVALSGSVQPSTCHCNVMSEDVASSETEVEVMSEVVVEEVRGLSGRVVLCIGQESGIVTGYHCDRKIKVYFHRNCLHVNGRKCSDSLWKKYFMVGTVLNYDAVIVRNNAELWYYASRAWIGKKPRKETVAAADSLDSSCFDITRFRENGEREKWPSLNFRCNERKENEPTLENIKEDKALGKPLNTSNSNISESVFQESSLHENDYLKCGETYEAVVTEVLPPSAFISSVTFQGISVPVFTLVTNFSVENTGKKLTVGVDLNRFVAVGDCVEMVVKYDKKAWKAFGCKWSASHAWKCSALQNGCRQDSVLCTEISRRSHENAEGNSEVCDSASERLSSLYCEKEPTQSNMEQLLPEVSGSQKGILVLTSIELGKITSKADLTHPKGDKPIKMSNSELEICKPPVTYPTHLTGYVGSLRNIISEDEGILSCTTSKVSSLVIFNKNVLYIHDVPCNKEPLCEYVTEKQIFNYNAMKLDAYHISGATYRASLVWIGRKPILKWARPNPIMDTSCFGSKSIETHSEAQVCSVVSEKNGFAFYGITGKVSKILNSDEVVVSCKLNKQEKEVLCHKNTLYILQKLCNDEFIEKYLALGMSVYLNCKQLQSGQCFSTLVWIGKKPVIYQDLTYCGRKLIWGKIYEGRVSRLYPPDAFVIDVRFEHHMEQVYTFTHNLSLEKLGEKLPHGSNSADFVKIGDTVQLMVREDDKPSVHFCKYVATYAWKVLSPTNLKAANSQLETANLEIGIALRVGIISSLGKKEGIFKTKSGLEVKFFGHMTYVFGVCLEHFYLQDVLYVGQSVKYIFRSVKDSSASNNSIMGVFAWIGINPDITIDQSSQLSNYCLRHRIPANVTRKLMQQAKVARNGKPEKEISTCEQNAMSFVSESPSSASEARAKIGLCKLGSSDKDGGTCINSEGTKHKIFQCISGDECKSSSHSEKLSETRMENSARKPVGTQLAENFAKLKEDSAEENDHAPLVGEDNPGQNCESSVLTSSEKTEENKIRSPEQQMCLSHQDVTIICSECNKNENVNYKRKRTLNSCDSLLQASSSSHCDSVPHSSLTKRTKTTFDCSCKFLNPAMASILQLSLCEVLQNFGTSTASSQISEYAMSVIEGELKKAIFDDILKFTVRSIMSLSAEQESGSTVEKAVTETTERWKLNIYKHGRMKE